MKKVLSTVAALGLVAGMSASASALEWTISGDYLVQGVNLNHASATPGFGFAGPRAGNFNNGTLNINGPDDEQNSDAYYWHQFRTDVTMKVNDNIKVVSEIYMIDAYTIWEDTTGCATENGNYVNVFKLWMQYTTPFGLFEIGRMPNGQVLNAFTNTDLQGDGIKFSPTLPEPFVLSLTTQKVDEDDGVFGSGLNDITDGDYDYYHVSAGYHTEKIVIDTALRFWDDARSKDPAAGEFNREYWTWWLAGDLTFGKFYAKGELSWTFGDWESYEDDDNNDDLDIDSATTLDIDFTYMVTNNFGVELLLDLSSKHDITSGGTKIGDVVVLPPALIAQWHFMPNNNIRPYAGAGINYTMFFSESTASSVLGNTDLSVDDAFGLVAQAGVDIDINKDWYVNFDAKYIDLDTDATLSGDVNGSVSFDINPLVLGVGVGTKF